LSPLNDSIRGPKAIEKPKKKQKRGFPIKDFGNDVGGGGCLIEALRHEGRGKPSTEDSTYSSPLWGVRVRVVFAIL